MFVTRAALSGVCLAHFESIIFAAASAQRFCSTSFSEFLNPARPAAPIWKAIDNKAVARKGSAFTACHAGQSLISAILSAMRSEERRVGKGWVSTGRSWGWTYHDKKTYRNKK